MTTIRALLAAAALTATAALTTAGCTAAECGFGEYDVSQCRVAAEHHYARLVTSSGVELRFQQPDETDPASWDATGVFEPAFGGAVKARPAGLTDFAFTVDPRESGATSVTLHLDNVAAETVVTIDDAEVPHDAGGIGRTLEVPLAGDLVWVRGVRPCPDDYVILAAGDVQTGPTQFERVLEAMHDEADDAGAPLLGLLLLGDLAEDPAEDELRLVESILRRSPVPVAVTPGNHDVHGDELALFNRIYGPGNHAFDACRTRVALFDTGNADLAESIQARLGELLERGDDDFLIAGTHYPAWSGRTGNGWRDEPVAWTLMSELVRHDADLLIAGHYHNWREYPHVKVGDRELHEILSGTLGATQGNGAPHYGYTRLTFTGGEMRSCFVEVPEPGRAPGDHRTGVVNIRFCDEE